jgi:hypothetical protein
MPRKTSQHATTISSDETTQTMTDQTVTSNISELAKSVSLVSNQEKTSYRIEVRSRSNVHEWDAAKDLSLVSLEQARPAMNAVARWVAGGLAGSPKLIIVAPVEKAGYENGTGRFAYVRHDYQAKDSVVVEIDGNPISLAVDPQDVPDRGYRRLYLDGGELYSKSSYEGVFTNRGEVLPSGEVRVVERNGFKDDGSSMYWFCRASSALLDGSANLSISIGPRLMDQAEQIMGVVTSPDPAAANSQRLYNHRQVNRFSTEVHEAAAELRGNGEPVNASDVSVSLVTGGTIPVTKLAGKLVKLYTESGIYLNSRNLSNRQEELVSFAHGLALKGWTVGL